MGVVARLVFVVGLVVPRAVVEILVVVGDLVAVQPVDGDTLVRAGIGGASIVAGVDGLGAANCHESIAVRLDVGMAGCSSSPDEGVVIGDYGRRAISPGAR